MMHKGGLEEVQEKHMHIMGSLEHRLRGHVARPEQHKQNRALGWLQSQNARSAVQCPSYPFSIEI